MSSSSDASSYSSEEEEEEVRPPIKKPAVESSEEEEEEVRPPPKKPATKSTAAPPPKPTAAAASEAQTPKSKPLSKPSIPDSSSDEEEVEEESESESDSDTDEKATKTQQPPPPKPAATPVAAAAAPSADSGSTTDGSDSSDSESSDQPAPPRHSLRVAEPAIKPLSSKPMDGNPVKDVDKKKKAKAPEPVATEEGSIMHKRPFQRIWSGDDEMVLLRGLADYHAKKGIVPSSATDMEAFHNIVQKSLAVTVNKGQLFNKIRALKKKHENATTRRSKGGAQAELKPRDEAAWELSKQIWGNGGNSGKVKPEKNREKMTKKEPNVASSEDEDEGGSTEDGNDSSSHPLLKKAILHTGSRKRRAVLAEESMQMLGDSKARELERKYKKLAIEEMKMDELRVELLMESQKLFRDALAKLG